MPIENIITEYKSIRKVRKGSEDFPDLAKTCVCLANAQGGLLIIGIEDRDIAPPSDQRISAEELNVIITTLRSRAFNVGLSDYEVKTHPSGGQYCSIRVLPSLKAIATTSDGRIYIRVADSCQPIRSEDIVRIVNEKEAFQWELLRRSVNLSQAHPKEIENFIRDIRQSPKVSSRIAEKTDIEILEYYNCVVDGNLTNVGTLWLGTAQQRAAISYPVTVQYIVYDEKEEKIRKETWFDSALNPKDLLLDIEAKAVELTYFDELPTGMFRKQIRRYPQEVIRELLVNAVAHKSYTISGDIFIEVYPNRLCITNPGGLPLGVTTANILHARQRRNPHLMNILHDLNLMEGEGSGFDLIYEKLSQDAKPFPTIDSSFGNVSITQSSQIIDEESIMLLDYVNRHFTELRQKEHIALGIIARSKKILATQLSKTLQLAEEERLQSWIDGLLERQIIIQRGSKKASAYLLNPMLIKEAKLNIKPTLKTVEDHVLKALILEDLKLHSPASISEIVQRLKGVHRQDVQRIVYGLVSDGVISGSPGRKTRTYTLA